MFAEVAGSGRQTHPTAGTPERETELY